MTSASSAGTKPPAAFNTSQDRFAAVLAWLEGEQAAGLSHGELEERLQVDARELFRQLLQDHLDLRSTARRRTGACSTWSPRCAGCGRTSRRSVGTLTR